MITASYRNFCSRYYMFGSTGRALGLSSFQAPLPSKNIQATSVIPKHIYWQTFFTRVPIGYCDLIVQNEKRYSLSECLYTVYILNNQPTQFLTMLILKLEHTFHYLVMCLIKRLLIYNVFLASVLEYLGHIR